MVYTNAEDRRAADREAAASNRWGFSCLVALFGIVALSFSILVGLNLASKRISDDRGEIRSLRDEVHVLRVELYDEIARRAATP